MKWNLANEKPYNSNYEHFLLTKKIRDVIEL